MRRDARAATALAAAAALTLAACHGGTLDLKAADQASFYDVERKPAPDVRVPEGYRAVVIAEGFNFPSSMAWDDKGRLYVLESHTVAVPTLAPKLLRVERDRLREIPFTGPSKPTGAQAVGLAHHGGWLFVSHEEKDGTWGISRLKPDGGDVEAVLRGIPARGDHWVNYLLFDAKGNLYFGVGSATNSGVVSSKDPVNQKWLEKRPDARDIPCKRIVLTEQRFADDDALTPEKGDRALTGAYQAYRRAEAHALPGEELCTGALYVLPAGERRPRLVAWGFRNPVALALDPRDGKVLIGMHGADVRGTRPVRNDPDAIYRLREGAWYGWPDYSADLRPVTDPHFRAPESFFPEGVSSLSFVIDHAASGLAAPDRSLLVTATEPHAALGGMAAVPRGTSAFRSLEGRLLISEMGDFKPTTDATSAGVRTGFQVEAVDLASGKRTVFARNRGEGPAQPASRLDLKDALERPVDVKVGPDGLVYILDFGVFNPADKGAKVFPKTGRVFRVEPAR